jgi:uncharacterized protein (DUF736 family)
MTTIGKFHLKDESYQGHIETLTWNTSATIEPVTGKTGEKGPAYRVRGGRCEIGAAWKKTSQAGKAYLSVTIDDPSFPAPINANLFETPDGYDLVWTRP